MEPTKGSASDLCIFTIDFPLGKGETFLNRELVYLAKAFEAIYIFPMECLDQEVQFALPENVKVIRFNSFDPYNRIRTVLSNIGLITRIYLYEVVFSSDRFKYLTQFKSTINNLSHKVAVAESLRKEMDKLNLISPIAYTYWFNQWTLILSLMKAKGGKFPLFTRIHGMDVYAEQHTSKNFFFQFRTFQLTKISNIFAISQNGIQHLVSKFPKAKMELARLGVEDSGLNKSNLSDGFRIVSCSAFQLYKRVHLISEILSHLKFKIEWIHFGDGELRESVIAKANQLPDNVSFVMMGYKSNEEVLNYYRTNEVDLFINTSSTEGIPVSIMEAISFGIPVIAPNVGGVSEIVNEQTGYLIEKEFDTKKVSEIISRHKFLDKNLVSILRRSSREFWLQNYSAEKNYTSFSKKLEETCVE